LGLEHARAVLDESAAREVLYAASRADMRLEELDRQPLLAHHRAVMLDHPDDLAAIFLRQEFRRIIADLAEALDDDAFAFEPAGQPGGLHILGMAEELIQRVLDAPPGRLGPALDPAGVQRLAGDTGAGVDVGGVQTAVL